MEYLAAPSRQASRAWVLVACLYFPYTQAPPLEDPILVLPMRDSWSPFLNQAPGTGDPGIPSRTHFQGLSGLPAWVHLDCPTRAYTLRSKARGWLLGAVRWGGDKELSVSMRELLKVRQWQEEGWHELGSLMRPRFLNVSLRFLGGI